MRLRSADARSGHTELTSDYMREIYTSWLDDDGDDEDEDKTARQPDMPMTAGPVQNAPVGRGPC